MRGNEILLGMKKRGFGAGKWNGFGGKLEGVEDLRDAAVRELREESGLAAAVSDIEEVARIRFFEMDVPMFDNAIFLASAWTGEEVETEEMRPRWFASDALPYDSMWAADRLWMPLILSGKKIEGVIRFKPGATEVDDFSWHLMP